MNDRPKLRFPKFQNDWEEKQLGEIANFLDSKRIPLSEEERNKRKGQYPYYGASGIIDYVDDFIFDGEYVLLGEDGANIVNRSTRLAFIISGKVWVNNHAHVLESKGSNYFLSECLERIDYRKFNTGTAQPKLNADVCKKIKVYVPEIKEQQKIASFLSAIDTKIQLLTKKGELLNLYKKGVMQKLFKGEIRFKDENGNDFTDWEVFPLGELAIKINQKNVGSEIKNVLTNSATQGIINQRDYFDKDIANQNNLEGYYVVDSNDFVYNPRISVHAPVGPINRNNLDKGVMSPLYLIFKFHDINIDFMEYFFQSSIWHRYMSSIANYGARHDRMNITNSDFFKMPIGVPSALEMKKVAGFLRDLDTLIQIHNIKLKLMQKFKKGLLQQMFV